jgi:hypothetical protein
MIGAVGLTLSVLAPAGEAEFDGASFQVRAEAGSIVSGRPVRVTGFDPWRLTVREVTDDEIAALAQGETPVGTDTDRKGAQGFVGPLLLGFLVIGGSIWSFAAGHLVAFALLLAWAGYLWLLFLMIRECQRGAIILFLLVPYFICYFAWQRWDIAKWPFLMHVLGVASFLLGIARAG